LGENAGGKMKSITGWNPNNTDANNSSGFSGLPGGSRSTGGVLFTSIGNYGNWWSSSTESGTNNGLLRYLINYSGGVFSFSYPKGGGYSVRCVRD
jgi:uncharacterized protein (TIGR02145 family)